MNPNKALWEKGDFTRIAETMRESGEELARSLGIVKGMDVLETMQSVPTDRNDKPLDDVVINSVTIAVAD